MPYCTAANVRARIPAFPQDEEHEGFLVEAMDVAASEVDSALGARYQVPFADPAPDIIRHIAADLAAAWALDTAFSGGGEETETRLSKVLRGRARERLEQVSEGTWRGINTLTSRDVVPGQSTRPGVLTSTKGTTSALGAWVHPGLA